MYPLEYLRLICFPKISIEDQNHAGLKTVKKPQQSKWQFLPERMINVIILGIGSIQRSKIIGLC